MSLPVLLTARLELSPIERDDFESLHAIWRHAEVRRYLFDDAEVTRARAEAVFTMHESARPGGLGMWTVRLGGAAASRTVIGCAGLFHVGVVADADPSLRGEIEPVVALAPSAWKQGFAVEALLRVLEYGFTGLGLAEIVGAADAPNAASIRMLERAGFRREGEFDGTRYRLVTFRLARADFTVKGPAGD